MPPKPWETKPRHSVTSEEIKASAGSLDPLDLTKSSAGAALSSTVPGAAGVNALGASTAASPYSGAGAYGSSYGSSYGSRYGGGYGGGYGSSYGSSYGGYGGYGMGGYGSRYGMMGGNGMRDTNNPQPSLVDKSMQFLDSFGFLVNMLCDVSRNIEMNAEGLHRFGYSIFNLFLRMKNWGSQFYHFLINLFKRLLVWFQELFTRRIPAFILLKKENHLLFKQIVFKYATRAMLVLLAVCFLPIFRRSRGSFEAAFSTIA